MKSRIFLVSVILLSLFIQSDRALADGHPNPKHELGPIHIAARDGDEQGIYNQLGSGVNVDARTEGYFFTPLHFAVRGGHLKVVQLLLDRGANVNARTKECIGDMFDPRYLPSESVLHLAVRSNNAAVVRLILDKHPTTMTVIKPTPYHLAKELNPPNPEIVGMLESQVDSPRYENFSTKLHLADSVQEARTLLRAGLSIDYVNDLNQTVLHTAAGRKKCGLLPFFRAQKPKDLLFAKDNQGKTALHQAAHANAPLCVRALLSGLDQKDRETFANEMDQTGQTALHFAVRQKDSGEVVSALLRAGARPIQQDYAKVTPAHLARDLNPEALHLMERAGLDLAEFDRLNPESTEELQTRARLTVETKVGKGAQPHLGKNGTAQLIRTRYGLRGANRPEILGSGICIVDLKKNNPQSHPNREKIHWIEIDVDFNPGFYFPREFVFSDFMGIHSEAIPLNSDSENIGLSTELATSYWGRKPIESKGKDIWCADGSATSNLVEALMVQQDRLAIVLRYECERRGFNSREFLALVCTPSAEEQIGAMR